MNATVQAGEFAVCAMLSLLFSGVLDLLTRPLLRKNKSVRVGLTVLEIVCFLAFAALCVAVRVRLGFSDSMPYHYLGYAVGVILYLKTFRIIVDFFQKVCYTIVK